MLRGGEQSRHVVRVVREVAVHLQDQLCPVGKRPPERSQVRRPEALLARPMENVDEIELSRELVCKLARSRRAKSRR